MFVCYLHDPGCQLPGSSIQRSILPVRDYTGARNSRAPGGWDHVRSCQDLQVTSWRRIFEHKKYGTYHQEANFSCHIVTKKIAEARWVWPSKVERSCKKGLHQTYRQPSISISSSSCPMVLECVQWVYTQNPILGDGHGVLGRPSSNIKWSPNRKKGDTRISSNAFHKGSIWYHYLILFDTAGRVNKGINWHEIMKIMKILFNWLASPQSSPSFVCWVV